MYLYILYTWYYIIYIVIVQIFDGQTRLVFGSLKFIRPVNWKIRCHLYSSVACMSAVHIYIYIYTIITTAAYWAARLMRVRCIYYNMPLVYYYSRYLSIHMHNIYILYGHAHTQSDRLMSANSLSPRPRCELIEFYGRYHLLPAGGPGLQCSPRWGRLLWLYYIIYILYIVRFIREHTYAYYILLGHP